MDINGPNSRLLLHVKATLKQVTELMLSQATSLQASTIDVTSFWFYDGLPTYACKLRKICRPSLTFFRLKKGN